MPQTLIIIGAGASKDIYSWFPTGFSLCKEINYHLSRELKDGEESSSMDNRHLSAMTNLLYRYIKSVNGRSITEQELTTSLIRLKQFLWNQTLGYEFHEMRDQLEKANFCASIDEVIYRNFKEDLIAKAITQFSIAYLLKGSERGYYEKHNFENNWISTLVNKLPKDYQVASNITKKVSIVSFNYERTFHFLWNYFTEKKYGNAIDIESNIRYVYGSLGNFKDIPYDYNNDDKEMEKVWQKLDLLRDNELQEFPWKEQEYYDQIIFLGFGFDQFNMSKINIDRFNATSIKSTSIGLTETQKAELKCKHNILFNQNEQKCIDIIESLVL